jgi:glyoxylase-like metal-dependent hydrolase (beta-lactamase superfamily II)
VVVGSVEVFPVLDAIGLLGEYADLYPEVEADAWEPYHALYPELFSGPSWRLPCKCYVVRTAGQTVLVDAGVGPPGLWDWTAEDEGRLPEALSELGVRPEDVDVVFLTHLHRDHLGWATDLEGVPLFPRARYLVHRDALAFARTLSDLPHIRRCVEPLADRFEQLESEVEIAPGLTAFPAPGHYPGHMALRLASEGRDALLLADVAVHPAMLHDPGLAYVADVDLPTSIGTRRSIVPCLVDRDVLVACAHYPGSGIGRVVTRDDRVVWEEAS